MPEDRAYWNAIRSYSSYYPSEDLSGDLFDVVKINDDSVLFYIADVSGHGVRSSLLTIFLRQVVRGMKTAAADPIIVLAQIIKDYKALNIDEEHYISLLYGVYNSKTKGLTMMNAGHNCLPIVMENKGGKGVKITELDIRGLPVCSLINAPNHEVKTLQMEKGDKILLYTDGITEAVNSNNKVFGTERLKNIISEMGTADGKKLAEGIINEARKFAGGSPMDDMAVLVLELL